MIFTPEERRAVLALAVLLAFGQVVSWWERWERSRPDAELSAWLTRLAEIRAAADSSGPPVEGAVEGVVEGVVEETAEGSDGLADNAGTRETPWDPDRRDPAGDGSAPPPVQSGRQVPAHAAARSPATVREKPPPRPPVSVRSRDAVPPGILETGKLRINEASEEQLQSLPGVGPALAARIAAARRERPFASPEDLLRVPGIGPRTLERLRPRIEIAPASRAAG